VIRVMVSVLASSVVDRWFESRSALRRKSKDWSARNQDNLFEWDDMSIHGLLFQLASTIKNPTKRVAPTRTLTKTNVKPYGPT
jgi:hypothetical protein